MTDPMKSYCGITIMQGLKGELGSVYKPNMQERRVIHSIIYVFEEVESLIETLNIPLKTAIETCLVYSYQAELLREVSSLFSTKRKDERDMLNIRRKILQNRFDIRFNLVEYLVKVANLKGRSDPSVKEIVMISLATSNQYNIHLTFLEEVSTG
jgi:LPS O-antigen subunit length determinant protein (WzzB/FepE family)